MKESRPPPIISLVKLLDSMFSPAELIDLLENEDRYTKIAKGLIYNDRNTYGFMVSAVLMLSKHILLDEAFFDLLLAARPLRALELQAVSDAYFDSFHSDRPLNRSIVEPAYDVDKELKETALRFFRASNISHRLKQDGSIQFSRYQALLAKNSPPTESDLGPLYSLFKNKKHHQAIFIYRGILSSDVSESLNDLRVQGNPILPLSESMMKAALADGQCSSVLREMERSYFEPQNMFFRRNAIIDPGAFFGRDTLLTRIGATLQRGDAALITGLRKVGKTSLMFALRRHLSDFPWCWIDLQRFSVSEDWSSLLFTDLIEAIDRWGKSKWPDSDKHWPDGPKELVVGNAALERALKKRFNWMQDRGVPVRVILVLDEFERVFPRTVDAVRTFVSTMGILRSLAQSVDRPLSILAADLRPLSNQVNVLPDGQTNPLYSFFEEIPLPLFTYGEVEQMVRTIGRSMGIDIIQEDFLALLHAQTGGHPFLVRLMAGRAFENRNKSILDVSSLEKALDVMVAADELGVFFRENIWLSMTDYERAFIKHLYRKDGLSKPFHSSWITARAALTAQGIVKDGAVAIQGFDNWLSEEILYDDSI